MAARQRRCLRLRLQARSSPRRLSLLVVCASTVFDCFRFMELAETGRCRASVPPPQTHQGGLMRVDRVRSRLAFLFVGPVAN